MVNIAIYVYYFYLYTNKKSRHYSNFLESHSKEIVMAHNKNYIPGSFLQFSPSIVFIFTFMLLYLFFASYYTSILPIILMSLPLCTVLMTTAYAFFTFKKTTSVYEKIRIFFSGSINQSTSYFYASFIGSAIFCHALAITGGIVTAINLGVLVLPAQWILPVMFLIAIGLSMVIKSWTVSVVVFMPISYGIAQCLQIDVALMASTMLSGIICGYQLSMFSGVMNQYEKIKEILWLIVPAVGGTCIVLCMYRYQLFDHSFYQALRSSLFVQDYITIVPLLFFIVAATLHADLIMNIFVCSCSSLAIGIFQNKISYADAVISLFEGYYSQPEMIKLMILCILLSGLTNIINYNHGFHYLVDLVKQKNKNGYVRQFSMIFILIIISTTIGLDTVSINVLMPMMKKISDRYAVSYQRVLALLYVISTTVCCFLPYASCMLLASYLGRAPMMSMIQYMLYPAFIIAWSFISVCIGSYQKTSKKYFYRSLN